MHHSHFIRGRLLVVCMIILFTPVAHLAGEHKDYDFQAGSGAGTVLEIDRSVLKGLSDEERQWYERFQHGVAFFEGWAAISAEILTVFPPEKLLDRQHVIQRLGIKIGTEWCRDNNVRRIDTGMLQEWGKRLRSAIGGGAEETDEALGDIEREVDLILGNPDQLTMYESRP